MNLNEMVYTPQFYIILYMLIINLYGFTIMGVDKWKAWKGRYRIPEKTIFIIASIGGSAGIFCGMRLFHHKTLHNKFKYGIPALLIANIICIVYILYILQ